MHLKGHFAPSRFAAAYWRQQSKDTGEPVNAKIVNTASESGLYGNAGQANYAAAKAGIASMTIVMARELERTGVRVNAIAPVALTRLTEDLAGRRHERGDGEVDARTRRTSPRRACWLASDLLATASRGQVLKIQGGIAQIVQGLAPAHARSRTRRALDDRVDRRRAATQLFAKSDPGIPPFLLELDRG